jgi:hypothetical protein
VQLENLFVTYHQFGILEDGSDWPAYLDAPANGLTQVAGGAVIIHTGVHTGPVSVAVALLGAPPDRIDTGRGWESIAETSVQAGRRDLRVRALEEETGLPPLNTEPGALRIRVHATGRDTDIDGTVDIAVEFYLLQVWPAPFADDITHLAADRYGQQLRETPPAPPAASDEPDGVTYEEWV